MLLFVYISNFSNERLNVFKMENDKNGRTRFFVQFFISRAFAKD